MKRNDLTPARIAVGLYLKRQIDALENDYVADDLTDFAKQLAQQVAQDLLEGVVDVKTNTPAVIEVIAPATTMEEKPKEEKPKEEKPREDQPVAVESKPKEIKPDFTAMLKPKQKEPVC